jgi:pyrroloquinoline-quinone synthase
METAFSSSIEKWNLLNHPFYRAWNNGSLPAEKLKQYAAEYGAFISTIGHGWAAAGEPMIAAEESEHFEIWKKFANSLGVNKIYASAKEVKELVKISNENYSTYSTALGCLFAFEAQQPHTTASKKAGLSQHYSALNADETYFDIHMSDEEEQQLLLQKIEMLSPEEKMKATVACEKTCEALWNALSGIMG